MKSYSISQVARMMGISSETLRNYERRGLIAPLRDEKQYRTYTMPDIYMMSGVRFLRNSGYSFEDIERLYSAPHEDAVAIKRRRCKEIEEEIAYLALKLKAVQEECAEYEALMESCEAITWTVSPAMLRIDNLMGEHILDKDEYVPRWIEHLPLVRVSPAFSREAVLKSLDEVKFGYVVPLALAGQLGLGDTPNAVVKPTEKCLTTVVCSRGEQYLSAGQLDGIRSYCSHNNLILSDEVWGITLGTHMEDGDQVRYHRLYIPATAEKSLYKEKATP